jgi:ArsR family transcriptional regulator
VKNMMKAEAFGKRVDAAAAFLRSIASQHRLMILCTLIDGERSAGDLAEQLGLIPSNLSQHLAKLRREQLVAARREGTVIYYRLNSDRVEPMLRQLYRMFCADLEPGE